jgi:hypothetical protein
LDVEEFGQSVEARNVMVIKHSTIEDSSERETQDPGSKKRNLGHPAEAFTENSHNTLGLGAVQKEKPKTQVPKTGTCGTRIRF